jgi:histidinol dehydrogenase
MSANIMMRRMMSENVDFDTELATLLDRRMIEDEKINKVVSGILADVRQRGDEAVLEYTRQFDKRDVSSMSQLEVSKAQMQAALDHLTVEQRDALLKAAERIRLYHQRQLQPSWQYEEEDGSVYGQLVIPLQRVGLYVPGGKARMQAAQAG